MIGNLATILNYIGGGDNVRYVDAGRCIQHHRTMNARIVEEIKGVGLYKWYAVVSDQCVRVLCEYMEEKKNWMYKMEWEKTNDWKKNGAYVWMFIYLAISTMFPCGIVVWISALSHKTVTRFSLPNSKYCDTSVSKGKWPISCLTAMLPLIHCE